MIKYIIIILFISIGNSIYSSELLLRVIDYETSKVIENAKVILDFNEIKYTNTFGEVRFQTSKKKIHIDILKDDYLENHLDYIQNNELDTLIVKLRSYSYKFSEIEVTDKKLRLKEEILDNKFSKVHGSKINENINVDVSNFLSDELGIDYSGMGRATNRPVVNGLNNQRLIILENTNILTDLSGNSPDHAMALSASNLRSIEILSGPSLVQFTPSIIGSVINFTNNLEHEYLPKESIANVGLAYNSSDNGLNSKINFNDSYEQLAYSMVIGYVNSGDIRTPDFRIKNSYRNQYDLGLGLSYFYDDFKIGVTGTIFENDYGIPGGFVGGHPNGVDISLLKGNLNINSNYHLHGKFIEDINLRINRTFYDHKEFEASGNLGAQFRFISYNGNLFFHQHQNSLINKGNFGLNFEFRENKLGGFVFTPWSIQRKLGFFIYEDLNIFDRSLELGFRYDYDLTAPRSEYDSKIGFIREREFSFFTASIAHLVEIIDEFSVRASISKSNRAPQPEELFSEGPHLAAYSYEIGNPDLNLETGVNYSLDFYLSLPWLSLKSEWYYYSMGNYIFPTNTGDTNFSTLLLIFKYDNVRAEIFGTRTNFDIFFSDDIVFSSSLALTYGNNLSRGGYLPLIPPETFRFSLDFPLFDFDISLNNTTALAQNRVDIFELPNDFYSIFGFSILKKVFIDNSVHSFKLDVRNIFDNVYTNHLSRIKEIYPEPGINVSLIYNLYY